MKRSAKSPANRPANRFYSAAKISEYQFQRVLRAFVAEEPANEAARKIALSANSIDALYRKLRVYFTELGVFYDIYEGGDPEKGTRYGPDFEEFERRLIAFHLERTSRKRRMKATRLDEIDYNWCESIWRFHYSILTQGRPSEAITRMMTEHLKAHILLCGPVGQPPRNREQSRKLSEQQRNQRLLWLRRNAPAYRSGRSRADIDEIMASPFDPGRH